MLDTLLDVLSQGWGLMLLKGAAMTIVISALGMVLGTLIGIAGASIKINGPLFLKGLVSVYTTLVRSIPELLIIYLLFFGTIQWASDLSHWLNWQDGINKWFPFIVGVLAIGLISGSYIVEVFRGALQAIPNGQIEAARAVGMSKIKILCRITIPQMFWYALPGANNVWQTALKDTALISLVGLVELMRAAVLGAASTREPLALYVLAGALYFVIGVASQGVFTLAERYYGRGMALE